MSADDRLRGYLRVPRLLITASLEAPHKFSKREAVLFLIERASFVEYEYAPGLMLRPGETPPLSLSDLEREWRWGRMAVRTFLSFLSTDEAVARIGVRVRQGQRWTQHSKQHSQEHRTGHTYVVAIKTVAGDQEHCPEHSAQHSQQQPLRVSPPTGEKPEKKGREEGKRIKMGLAARRHEYDPEFLSAWGSTPYRLGNNPKLAAYEAWLARRKEGVPSAEMQAGAERYAAFCDAMHLTGTDRVMRGSTLFGPHRPYEQEWELPETNGNGRPR